MDEPTMPPGTYRVLVMTSSMRGIAGDDPSDLWADIYSEGAATSCGTVALGTAKRNEDSTGISTLSTEAQRTWGLLLQTLREEGETITEEDDPGAIVCVRVAMPRPW